MSKASILQVAGYLPERIVSNEEVESKINVYNAQIETNGILSRLFGSKTRRYACASTQVSDLACLAAKKILATTPKDSIDLLIFAAASSDLIEPATANIIQSKLGLSCPVMDIKNACNSFVNAIQVSAAFIETGTYKRVLVVCGEKLSEVINFQPKNYEQYVHSLAGYTLGDAGAAMLIGKGEYGKIVYQNFRSIGTHWSLCTVRGGGSIAYRDYDQYFFETDSKELQDVFNEITLGFIIDSLAEANWTINEIDFVVSHQISSTTIQKLSTHLGLPLHKFSNVFGKYGNIAAATIPLSLSEIVEEGKIKSGDKLMLLGFAAGVSLSVQLIEW